MISILAEYLWGISFHAVLVFGLDKDLLFKSVLGRCKEFKILQVYDCYSVELRWYVEWSSTFSARHIAFKPCAQFFGILP